MARARNIKPGFFTNDVLAEHNDPLGRLLFIGLWTLADCNGNLEWRSKRIKAQLLPYDDCDIKQLGINLDKSGFVRFYSDGDKVLLHIPKFVEHQNPHKNERDKGASVAPFSEDLRQLIDLTTLTINPDLSGADPESDGSDRADSLLLNPDSPSLNPERGIPNDDASPPGKPDGEQRTHEYPPEFEEAWSAYPSRAGGNPKRKAHQAWNARLKSGADPEDITQGVQRYATFVRMTGKENTEFVMQAVTFFGPDEHYTNDWKPPRPGGPPGRQPTETPRERAIRMAREQGIPYDPQ